MTSEGLHEPIDRLSERTVDHHRAIVSLMEELEAVDWYDQRVDATGDGELAEVLAHNRDEEKEHAAMTLEWLRRSDAKLDEHLRTYLFTDGNLLEIEHAAESGEDDGSDDSPNGDALNHHAADHGSDGAGSLGLGSLRHLANTTPAIGGLL